MRAIEGGCLLWQRRRIQIASYPVRPIFLLGHQHSQNKLVHWLETTTTISVDVDGYGSGDDHVDVVVDGDCDDHVDVDVGNAIKWIVVLSSVSGCKLWSLHSVSRPLRDPDLIWIKNRTLSSPPPGGRPEWAGTSHLEMDKVVQSPQTNKLPCYHHSSPAIWFFLVIIWTRYVIYPIRKSWFLLPRNVFRDNFWLRKQTIPPQEAIQRAKYGVLASIRAEKGPKCAKMWQMG